MLLSTAYFPPLSWFALCFSGGGEVWIEACERYQKQTYRNRCLILAADGPQMLQVPVLHEEDMRIDRVKVDYATPWVLRTERALATAYESSAFFEFYRDSLFALLEAQPERLWDLNRSLLEWCFQRLHLPFRLKATQTYVPDADEDWRSAIHPKRPDQVLQTLGLDKAYYQVFRDRIGGFTPGLSILDLLFNEGPDSLRWLLRPEALSACIIQK